MSGFAIYLILILFIIFRTVLGGDKKGSGQRSTGTRGSAPGTGGGSASAPAGSGRSRRAGTGRGPLASDGHRIPKDQDISCRRFGHRHEEFDTPRYIPHTDLEEGYIVLNGVKMKRGEADRYEDSI
ncbi:MAG: hypothetical protein Q4D81_13885 [Eubacteriales bacterium]|nr:hypothetical protein [Eubacteriales bacterium]